MAATLGRRLLSSSLRADATYDVVVLGGGVIGAWTAVMAAKRGASVALAEQFAAPAHERGSSHGDGRIFRLAYEEEHYVDMMLHALPLWHELQEHAGEPMFATTGGLNTARRGEGSRGLAKLQALYERRGIAHELLGGAEARERFPQFRLSDDTDALFQKDFGVLFASPSVEAAWRWAESLGVTTHTGWRAATLRADGVDGATAIESDDGRVLRGNSVVVAPGAWLSPLSSRLFGLDVPSEVSAEVVSYFAPRDTDTAADAPDHSYASMPVLLPDVDNGLGDLGYYCLPMITTPGIKVSAHHCGPIVDPDRRPASAGGGNSDGSSSGGGGGSSSSGGEAACGASEEAAAAERVAAIVASNARLVADVFPHVEETPFLSQSCLYTTTPDHDYVLDVVPPPTFASMKRSPSTSSWGRVVLAGGGSGHAFKMGPALGECAAALALGMPPPLDVKPFELGRLLGERGRRLKEAPARRK